MSDDQKSHDYLPCCLDTQHDDPVCMRRVAPGQWCGKPADDPIHARPDEIRRRADAATPGPWAYEIEPGVRGQRVATVYAGRSATQHGLNLFGRVEPDWNGTANLDFVCSAREDIPYLLAALDAMTRRAEAAERRLAEIRERVGALDDEDTMDAVRDMMTEHEHYSREMNKAGYETIPRLQDALAEAERRLADLREAFIRHRTETHGIDSKKCITCIKSDSAILAAAPRGDGAGEG